MVQFLEIAIEAAQKAGQYLLQNLGKISEENVDEKARNDFVTYVDTHSEKIITDTLLHHFPTHQILAEEGTRRKNQTEYRWLIDPLDGTKNFIQAVPMFCVSIALQKKDEMILGVVYDPVHQELYSAEKGAGAFCNQEPIGVSHRNFSQSLIATGFPFRKKDYLPIYLLAFEEIFLRCSGMRRCGSAALDLCYTARGRFDGFWELGLSPWDVAAGTLLVQEAGGKVSDFWGETNFLQTGFIIAGNSEVQEKLLKILNHYFSDVKPIKHQET
ncbi:MAG: inositol monophosphatase family protein [Calditrichia bacterium]